MKLGTSILLREADMGPVGASGCQEHPRGFAGNDTRPQLTYFLGCLISKLFRHCFKAINSNNKKSPAGSALKQHPRGGTRSLFSAENNFSFGLNQLQPELRPGPGPRFRNRQQEVGAQTPRGASPGAASGLGASVLVFPLNFLAVAQLDLRKQLQLNVANDGRQEGNLPAVSPAWTTRLPQHPPPVQASSFCPSILLLPRHPPPAPAPSSCPAPFCPTQQHPPGRHFCATEGSFQNAKLLY